MSVINQAYDGVRVAEIKPHPLNPRRGDISAISNSIEQNGFFGACVVQKSTGHILAGNHRFLAAKEQGLEEVPVIWVDVDDDWALRILLADNRTNDLASYDHSALAEILSDLADTSSLLGTGYDGEALDEIIAGLAKEFKPVTDPASSLKEFTEADIAKTDVSINDKSKNLIEVLCPECGAAFYLDADNLKDEWKESQNQTASS